MPPSRSGLQFIIISILLSAAWLILNNHIPFSYIKTNSSCNEGGIILSSFIFNFIITLLPSKFKI